MNKITLNLDSTSLGSSSCILNYIRTTIGELDSPAAGAYKSTPNAAMIYGVGVHRFTDVMFKTGGHYPTAKAEADKAFNQPKVAPSEKKMWLLDHRHLLCTNYNLWSHIQEGGDTFDIISINQDCWWCEGKGFKEIKDTFPHPICTHCNGTGKVTGPATELTFRIPYYEDDIVSIFLCGTIDKVGKFKGGCYAIGDWKTTSSWSKDEYLKSYELSRQLRLYTLACKLMSKLHPDSTLGHIGSTKMGAFIDGIFLKTKANDNEYQRSDVFQFSDDEIEKFDSMLKNFCYHLSAYIHDYVAHKKPLPKEGILNGTCDGKWGKCSFWNCCKSVEHVSQMLLKRDFKRVIYDPLNFNDV